MELSLITKPFVTLTLDEREARQFLVDPAASPGRAIAASITNATTRSAGAIATRKAQLDRT